MAVCMLLGSAYFAKRRPSISRMVGLLGVFAAGALCLQLRSADPQVDTALVPFADRREVMITAHVVGEGSWRAAGFSGSRQSLELETEQVAAEGKNYELRSGLRLNIYSKQQFSEYAPEQAAGSLYRYGQRLRFPAKLSLPRNFRNPGAFDYQGYLADHGISALGSTREDEVELLPGFAGSHLQALRNRVRNSVLSRVHSLWPEQEAALIDAMVVGEAAFIEPETKTDFQRSGTYHILVVSGMNLSILAFVCFWTLRRLRLGDGWAGVLTILLALGYAFLTDVGPPIWRATFMLIILVGARLLYRERSMLNAIGFAAMVLLVADPRVLFGSSFQLTFLAVVVIAGLAIPVLERTTQPFHRGMSHPESVSFDAKLEPRVAQLRLDLRMIAGRMKRFALRIPFTRGLAGGVRWGFAASEILIVSAIMQLGLALPMAYWFHRATVVGLPANALVVPLTELLMPAAVVAVSASYCGLWIARLPALITAAALHGIVGTVKWLGAFAIADTRVAIPSAVVMICAGGSLVLALMLARRRPWLLSAGLATMMGMTVILCLCPTPQQVRRGMLEVTAIDVGQGDSTLIVTPEGKTLLLDAGGPTGGQGSSFNFGEQVVAPYLWSRGISKLDAVIVSHGHSDHIGGMPAILRDFRPREMWIGVTPNNADFKNLLAQARAQGMTIKERFEGDEFDYAGVHVRVFAPAKSQFVMQAKNNDSLVLTFSYQNASVMLEGDAEKQVERRIAAEQPGAVSLLKIAHNGSTTSTTPELLGAVEPGFAVISVGAHNTFGHPRMETLEKLSTARVRTYRTDLNGAVSFYLAGDGVREVMLPR